MRPVSVLAHMNLIVLIAFGLGTTLPCIGLWLADARDHRPR
jgi:hypothetical protein